jgi:hypothetical protein
MSCGMQMIETTVQPTVRMRVTGMKRIKPLNKAKIGRKPQLFL